VSIIDLNNPQPDYHYSLPVSREEAPAERNVRLIKELGVFALAVVFVSAIFWLAYSTVTSPTAGEEKKWAMSVLSAGAAGLVGYLVRK